MLSNQLRDLTLSPFLLSTFVGLLLGLFILIQIGVLRYVYMKLGFGAYAAMLLLLGSLIGSLVDIPIAELPDQQIVSRQEITYFGMHYIVPTFVRSTGAVIAVNIGGALIPGLMSVYLLIKYRLWVVGLAGTGLVALVCHALADPAEGIGIEMPVLIPAMTTAVVALLLSFRRPAPLAYISGSLGPLIGADLLNLDKVQGLGAPMASIGGAGLFDGIVLTGILAVLIASILTRPALGRGIAAGLPHTPRDRI
jgi:uncharacterized membrane protein